MSSGPPYSEVPEEYCEAYQRAYRRSLAEHPTELMSPARPGKRASQPSAMGGRLARAERATVELMAHRHGVLFVVALSSVGLLFLLALAYAAGRLFA